ncbi:MAG: hypothetical protein NT077_02055 [Candidatus Taylorbacteria bacterium]|nr:hypothetical protein [Candidatus Taylorbacteria bacterium]
MPDDNQNQNQDTNMSTEEIKAPEMPISDQSVQPNGSTPTNLPPTASESPTSDVPTIPVESQNGGVNEPESKPVEPPKEPEIEAVSASPVQPVSAPAPLTSVASQPESLAQQDQHGFIHALLLKAQAKIQFNKQKKLDKIIQFAQKKKIVANEDIQMLLHVSSATATRYLVKLVQQGRLARVGNPRDAKYQFLR